MRHFLKKNIFLSFIIIFVVSVLTVVVYAINTQNEGWQISPNTPYTVNVHGNCRRVQGNTYSTVFAPTRSVNEWNAFLAVAPGTTGVGISACTGNWSCAGPYDGGAYCGSAQALPSGACSPIGSQVGRYTKNECVSIGAEYYICDCL